MPPHLKKVLSQWHRGAQKILLLKRPPMFFNTNMRPGHDLEVSGKVGEVMGECVTWRLWSVLDDLHLHCFTFITLSLSPSLSVYRLSLWMLKTPNIRWIPGKSMDNGRLDQLRYLSFCIRQTKSWTSEVHFETCINGYKYPTFLTPNKVYIVQFLSETFLLYSNSASSSLQLVLQVAYWWSLEKAKI